MSLAARSVDEFRLLERIGEGTYGLVWRGLDLKSSEVVALKQVRMEKENDGVPVTCLREITLLSQLRHPNVVRLKEVLVKIPAGSQEPSEYYMSLEFCEHDVAKLLDYKKGPFSEAEAKCLLVQLLRAVEHLHSRSILHRDIKLSNLLLNGRGELKLADFGLARRFQTPHLPYYTPNVVTIWYRAPELILGQPNYTEAIDMWSVGCVFAELLNHRPLFAAANEIEQMSKIADVLGAPTEATWPGHTQLPGFKRVSLKGPTRSCLASKFPSMGELGIEFLHRLLCYDPKERITAREALQHPYLWTKPFPVTKALFPTFPDTIKALKRKTADAQPLPTLKRAKKD
jgi:serine/threonine protein kinase